MSLNTPQDIQTAIHEAGHAIMSLYFDIIPDWVTIQPNDDETMDGYTSIKGHPIDPVAAIKHVLIDLAGYAALIAAGYDEEEAEAGTGDDFRNAFELISEWALPGILDQWQTVTVAFMNKPVNVESVDLAVDALLEHGSLKGDYVAALIERLPEHLFQQVVALEGSDPAL